MSIDMYLSNSEQQSQSIRNVFQRRFEGYSDLRKTLNSFVLVTPTLSGITYNSAKNYTQKILIPLLQGCILLDEAVKECCLNLPEQYRQRVDSVDLRETDLLDKIHKSDMIASRYMYLIDLESRRDVPNLSYLANLRESRNNYQDIKRNLEEKLYKLRQFNQYSSSIFSSVEDIYRLVQSGLNQANGAWDNSIKRFVIDNIHNESDWISQIGEKWSLSVFAIKDIINKGSSMTEEEFQKLANFLMENSNTEIYEQGIDSIRKYIDSKITVEQNILEFFKNVSTVATEEILADIIEKIDDSVPNLSNYLQFFVNSHPHFKDMNIKFDASGYSKALSTTLVKSIVKSLSSSINIPVSTLTDFMGQPISVQVSPISSMFLAVDFLQNLQNENAGRAFWHTATTSVLTTAGVQLATSGIVYGAVGGGAMSGTLSYVAGFALTHPVGWAIVAGIGVGYLVNLAYDNNFLGIKDFANHLGDNLNKSLDNIGRCIQSGWDNLCSWFGG